MYRIIMVPTDGSGFDREAIRIALRVAEQSVAKIKLVRVLSTASFFSMAATAEGTAIAAEVMHSERDNALSELYALAAECRTASDAEITVDLYSGPVVDVLADYATRHEVDLIVMSTHGRTGISRLSLGSVTDSLIRHTSIPVLVVKPPTSYLNPQIAGGFKRAVVPLDGSTLAEQILPRVVSLAKLDGAAITLLHILTTRSHQEKEVERNVWWDREISVAQDYLLRVAKRLRRSGTPVRTDIVISENIAEAIGDFAAREKVDLVAIATHGRGGLARMLRGSVADAVMHSARTSMLVFKPTKVSAKEVSPSVDWISADLIPA